VWSRAAALLEASAVEQTEAVPWEVAWPRAAALPVA
jgi:hypothetical protein